MVGLTRTEVIAAADASARLVVLTATQTLNARQHAGRYLSLSVAATAVTLTLPETSGSGNRYYFIVGALNTSTYVIQAGDASDEMAGVIIGADSDADTYLGYPALAGDDFDTITIGDVTRGTLGSWVELVDIAVDLWFVRGQVIQSGGSEATPFTSAVS